MNDSNEEGMNLYQKLAKIRAMSDVVTKDKQGYGYKYTDITVVLAKITAGMKKYGVSLIPSIHTDATVEPVTYKNTKIDKTGKPYENTSTEMLVSAFMNFRWVNDENPEEFIDVPWFMTGSQNDPSQAMGTSLTYALRQFLTNYFQIAQPENDIDAYRSKQKEAEVAEDRALAKELIDTFDSTVKQYLADYPEQKEDVAKFIERFVKGGNYFRIKEPVLAGKLLNDFKEQYLKEKK